MILINRHMAPLDPSGLSTLSELAARWSARADDVLALDETGQAPNYVRRGQGKRQRRHYVNASVLRFEARVRFGAVTL